VFTVPSLHVIVMVNAPTSLSTGLSVICPVWLWMLNSEVSSRYIIESLSASVQFMS